MARSALARTDRYSKGAIWFHWTIALLIIVNLTLGMLYESLFDGVKGVIPLHTSIGLTVIVLTLGRIAWRLAYPAPRHPPTMKPWERIAANTAHIGLYVLMLALPLTGWAMVSGTLKRRPLDFFGLFDVPYLTSNTAIGGAARGAHGLLGWVLLALIVLHVAAALRHRFVLKDGVLARMAPGVRAQG